MNLRGAIGILAGVAVFANCGCVDTSAKRGPEISPVSTVGPNPTLPQPEGEKLIPPCGWRRPSVGRRVRTPIGADGLAVSAFASGLAHPRWLYVLPNGDVSGRGDQRTEAPQR
jgi:glucose/arabinose dehydrogenase